MQQILAPPYPPSPEIPLLSSCFLPQGPSQLRTYLEIIFFQTALWSLPSLTLSISCLDFAGLLNSSHPCLSPPICLTALTNSPWLPVAPRVKAWIPTLAPSAPVSGPPDTFTSLILTALCPAPLNVPLPL